MQESNTKAAQKAINDVSILEDQKRAFGGLINNKPTCHKVSHDTTS